jgi:CO/xanthine dehydrogenase FAD-binding subunit
MDLNTVTSIVRPKLRTELPVWTAGDAWLAGGTWLFSEPQTHLNRLIDLHQFAWPPITASERGLEIAATCTVATLDTFTAPTDWRAATLIGSCCRAFAASFKIWKTATVGGNLCMSLPAGPMISLTAALDGTCTIWTADGAERKVRAVDFVTGNQRNVLGPGDLLRKIELPLSALRRQAAFRQISLTPAGRSAALLIGTLQPDGAVLLTITASTKQPRRLAFQRLPTPASLRDAILRQIPDDAYHDDVHGKPEWRQQMTLYLAEEIRTELGSPVTT